MYCRRLGDWYLAQRWPQVGLGKASRKAPASGLISSNAVSREDAALQWDCDVTLIWIASGLPTNKTESGRTVSHIVSFRQLTGIFILFPTSASRRRNFPPRPCSQSPYRPLPVDMGTGGASDPDWFGTPPPGPAPSLLHPIVQFRNHVEVRRPISTAAMHHSRHHEQPHRFVRPRHPHGIEDRIVVIDGVPRRNQVVVPAVIHNQFPPRPANARRSGWFE